MEKEEGEKKIRNRFEKKNWLMRMSEKQKCCHLISSQSVSQSSVLEISLLAIPMLTCRKTVRKEGFGPKCGF